MTVAIDAGLPILRCPLCLTAFVRDGRILRCASGHSFDLAKQGYVNLLGRAAPAATDTAEMVAARQRFWQQGHFRPIGDAVADLTGEADTVLEVGAGPGHYLQAAVIASGASAHLSLDISVAATRRAAAAGLAAAVADTWTRLPVAERSVAALLCIFAPRNASEFARVLDPGGAAIVVTPLAGHLAGLRSRYGLLDIPADKLDRLDDSFGASGLKLVERQRLTFDLELSPADTADLVAMGPNAFHGSVEIEQRPHLDQAAVAISCYRLIAR